MPETETTHFPCETCGSDLRFDPASGVLRCDHCGNTDPLVQTDAARAIHELDFDAASSGALDAQEIEEIRTTTCPNCAAEVSLDERTHATECPFCATPVVAGTGVNRHIKPGGLIPFTIDETTARNAMNDWLGGLWFAPGGLQNYARKGRRLNGIYVPYWTYDAATRTSYRGERGTIYYETRTVMRDGKRHQQRVARTRWRSVNGAVARRFDDVLVLASTSLPRADTQALAPWQLSALVPYTPEYLAGFRAESYAISLNNGFSDATDQMDAQIARDIRFDIGGDKQRIRAAETDIRNVTFKHVLLPVWLAAYKYRGKSYRFVVNGQTGAVRGARPYSAVKIAFAILAALILGAALMYGAQLANDPVLR